MLASLAILCRMTYQLLGLASLQKPRADIIKEGAAGETLVPPGGQTTAAEGGDTHRTRAGMPCKTVDQPLKCSLCWSFDICGCYPSRGAPTTPC